MKFWTDVSRLTPAYAAIFGFIATIAVHLGSGPDWNYMEYISEDCRSTWWQNALYINNYFQTTFVSIALSYWPKSLIIYTKLNLFVMLLKHYILVVYDRSMVCRMWYANVLVESAIYLSTLALEESWISICRLSHRSFHRDKHWCSCHLEFASHHNANTTVKYNYS